MDRFLVTEQLDAREERNVDAWIASCLSQHRVAPETKRVLRELRVPKKCFDGFVALSPPGEWDYHRTKWAAACWFWQPIAIGATHLVIGDRAINAIGIPRECYGTILTIEWSQTLIIPVSDRMSEYEWVAGRMAVQAAFRD